MAYKTSEERAAYRKAYYEKNKEARKAYQEKNKEYIAAFKKAYQEKNKESIAASKKAYYEKNKEDIKARSKAYYEKNKEAYAAYRKAYYEKNKEAYAAYQKAYDVLRRYGITLVEKKKMQDEQGNKCKICQKAFTSDCKSNVDHCHTSGKIRGLLCSRCNFGLGNFQDNPIALLKAAEYLEEAGNV